jgi:hypothetical protein
MGKEGFTRPQHGKFLNLLRLCRSFCNRPVAEYVKTVALVGPLYPEAEAEAVLIAEGDADICPVAFLESISGPNRIDAGGGTQQLREP